MKKKTGKVSMNNPFPVVVSRSHRDRHLETLDKERAILHKNFKPAVESQPLEDQYINSPLGKQRHKWLKNNNWVKTSPSAKSTIDPDVLVSYRNKITKSKIRVMKNGQVKEIRPDKSISFHSSWESFISSVKSSEKN